MVKGLQRFKEHFQAYTGQFVLIGGTACDLAMTEVGLPFRATKDLDIVLLIEALTPDFGRVFWEFIRLGGYATKEKDSKDKKYYRFSKPVDPSYPAMLELFSKVPEGLVFPLDAKITPIPIGEDISSLSAILLDEAYYGFLKKGKKEIDGLPIVGPAHLMALKARAWLDLTNRKNNGESIDRDNIVKHKRDIFRLFQIIDPEFSADIPDGVRSDMENFLRSMESDDIDLKSLGIKGMELDAIKIAIRKMFEVD